MTEKQARTKWCPFASARADGQSDDDGVMEQPFAANRAGPGKPDHWCLCIASDCMAWREYEYMGNPHGYCGLAGRPA